MTWMVIRLILTLAFVAGVLWFAARVAKKRGLGGGSSIIEVVARQRMGRSSTVAVLRVADRVLVVGTTEEHVTLLAEMDGEIVEEMLAEAEEERVAQQDARRAALAARRPVAVLEGPDDDDSPTTQIALPQLPGVPGARRPRKAPPATRHGGGTGGGLVAGSVFDRAAWTQVVEGLRERTVRR
ncbi:flagellar protein FliO/FliZ [Klenkia soli]|uniref:Flagellar protein FliO/FliZ n=1 Tax=Klenkia soli TaxID=1052260 RepID=A0A1H0CNF9_9ACTN|nr:flagellar biosynthetic protein FliO [Klenkia soli]SDN59374.1 flagellar protein FliO/FliZ [Klenkia soli]